MVKTPLNRSVWAASQREVEEDERQSYEAWAEDKIRRIAPLGRWQDEREYGAMAVFLASPLACNLTGQVINIDGGQVMRG
jgi:NAD(P)-dependent dehydrogenase (short-subunit alcohol dehydrogenase family)